MKVWRFVVLVAVSLVSLPLTAGAQAVNSTITGVVRDTSGAVLPGVTIEAASPALIEKVRSAVSDGEGLYRIVDLRPGEYTVTFTLAGFKTFKREGLELAANFTVTVNADMSLGALEETITVTGEAPVVDVQSTRQQTQFQRDTLESIPGTGRLTSLSQVIPGATLITPAQYSVGGINDSAQYTYTLHGAPSSEPIVDGMSQVMGGLTNGVFIYNQLTMQEVVVETSGVGADRETGGMQVNLIQRDGGNQFSGGFTYSFTGPSLEAGNITDELIARHLPPTQVGSLKTYYDTAWALGGPVKRDKIWFFGSFRAGKNEQLQQGNFYNKRQGTVFYEPDTSRPAATDQHSNDYTLRLTYQAAQNHKFVLASSMQPNCNCLFNLLNPENAILTAPEARARHQYNPQVNTNASWRWPATPRVLFETTFAYLTVNQQTKRQAETGTDVQVTDVGTNYRYGSRALNLGTTGSYIYVPRYQSQPGFTASYVTGAHVFKAGLLLRFFHTGDATRNVDGANQINQGMSYTFRNGLPTNVMIWATPYAWEENGYDNSFFAQDQWTLGRTTLNLGARYNNTATSLPEVHLAPGPFVGERVLPAVKNQPHWQNLNPRVGLAYDLFGNGRTAIKASLGRYNTPLRSTTTNPAAAGISPSTNRTWNDVSFAAGDPRNSNFKPDCDLLNPAANGECGPWSDLAFGKNLIPTRNAPDAISGFNIQDNNWQASASMQHQLRPGVGVNVGYFRTWYGGFLTTDNLAISPADFDPFCITVPTDSRLSNSGERLCGFYDIKPEKFGRVDNLVTQLSNYGTRKRVYNGMDATMNARFGAGGQFSGGLSIGRLVDNNCVTVDSPMDESTGIGLNAALGGGFCRNTPSWGSGTQLKFLVIYPLPGDLQTSVIYQNFAGVENGASYSATNAEIRQSLGRNLGQCGTAATCNASVVLDITPPGTMYEPRLNQIDLRFSKTLRLAQFRLRGNLDIANLFNASNVLTLQRRFGPTYLDAIQIMGGRLMKVGVQLDF